MNPLLENTIVSLSDPNTLIRFAGIYLLVIWVSVVIWVIKDITNRSDNVLLQVLSVLTVLVFTPLGIFIYLLIRPQSTLFERLYEREFRDLAEHESQEEFTSGHKALQEELNKASEKQNG